MDIAQLRKNLELSQVQFGNLFGVHPMTVSKWERGILEPSDYQAALMIEFERAAKQKEVRTSVGTVLVGAGIAAALLLLLNNSQK